MNKKFASIENVGKSLNYTEIKKVMGGKAKMNSLALGGTAIKKMVRLFRKL